MGKLILLFFLRWCMREWVANVAKTCESLADESLYSLSFAPWVYKVEPQQQA